MSTHSTSGKYFIIYDKLMHMYTSFYRMYSMWNNKYIINDIILKNINGL